MWNCLCRARLTGQSYKNRHTKDSSLSQDICQHSMHWPLALTPTPRTPASVKTDALVYCINGLTPIKGIIGSRCLTADGRIISANVPRAVHASALIPCICRLTAASKCQKGWSFTTSGCIASVTVSRARHPNPCVTVTSATVPKAGHTSALVHYIRKLTAAIEISPVAGASQQIAASQMSLSPEQDTPTPLFPI